MALREINDEAERETVAKAECETVVEAECETVTDAAERKIIVEAAQQLVEEEQFAADQENIHWKRLCPVDSINLEAGNISMRSFQVGWGTTVSLAFQSIGVVYGDIATSPLYVYGSTFTDGIHHQEDVLGVLSMILYTIVLIPLLKYVFIVLLANDNGNGGTLALYSLLCRYVQVGFIPNQQSEDEEFSNNGFDSLQQQKIAQKIKKKLENSRLAKILLFLVTVIGTSMVIADGVLTPSMSVLSAVSGIATTKTDLGQDAVVGISVAILIILFAAQRFGTDRVGFVFAPVIFLWLSFLIGIGLFNLFTYDVGVLRALNPYYIMGYFKRNGQNGWVSLGGIVLCITGTEAMFADLGHFNVRAIQLSFSSIVFPALATIYTGQAAYLIKHPQDVSRTFYASIPKPLYLPVLLVAVLAFVIASQAMITGVFSIIQQSVNLGCFPTVKVVHTSAKHEGQVYIPEINYLLMVACVLVTVGFKTTEEIGNAYGIAVVTVMVITTYMVSLVMLVIWKTNIILVMVFFLVFGTVETLYMSSVICKFTKGGYLPILFGLLLILIMLLWHYVHIQKHNYVFKNKVSSELIQELGQKRSICRVPGIGLLYSDLVQDISPVFECFMSNMPAIHSVFVMVSTKPISGINRVLPEDRFVFREIEPKDLMIFRCIVRYGYQEAVADMEFLEQQVVDNLEEFIRRCHNGDEGEVEEKMQSVEAAREKGVSYFLEETKILAGPNSSLLKKLLVNYVYNFLQKNSRQGDNQFSIPRSGLKIGMTYEI